MSAIEIRPIDPLVLGDGRPFSTEAGAQAAGGLEIPMPSTLAGAVRTALGRAEEHPNWEALQAVEVHGPLLYDGEQVLFPAPSDIALLQSGGGKKLHLARSRPSAPPQNGGADFPPEISLPCLLPRAAADLEPSKQKGPRWLTLGQLGRWYAEEPLWDAGCRDGIWTYDKKPEWDRSPITVTPRAHVGIAADRLASEKGKLFVTHGAEYRTGSGLLARAGKIPGNGPVTLGGERRVALSSFGAETAWECPLRERLGAATQVAMVLATPAIFAKGFWPANLSETLGITVTIVSVVSGRSREAVSGWDLLKRAPKPCRWLVPAGAVYFLEIPKGAGRSLVDRWLKAVSDDEESRRDGFGLALFFPTCWSAN